jgi:hypothetical protein
VRRAAVLSLVFVSLLFTSGWNLKNQKFPRGQRCGHVTSYGIGNDTTALTVGTYTPLDFLHSQVTVVNSGMAEWELGTSDVVEFCFRPDDELPGTFYIQFFHSASYNKSTGNGVGFGIKDGEGVAAGDLEGPVFFQTSVASYTFPYLAAYATEMNDNECIAPLFLTLSTGSMTSWPWTFRATEVINCRYQED